VVDPSEVGGLNAFNREIAEARLTRFFDHTAWLAKSHLAGLDYDGIVVAQAGDLISGDIHEELTETNEATTLETVLHWVERIASGIGFLAGEFGAVHVPWVVGNHGRRTRKPRAKRRARDNFDWLMGQMVRSAFVDDGRVTFDIPDGTDALIDVYETRILLTHGDQASGGHGIGGIWPPLMRLRAKKQDRYQAADRPFDVMLAGHWHQLILPGSLAVNGALKGFDEFAATMNFAPEPPSQMFATITPERGVTWAAPVYVADRKAEGW